MALKDKEKKKEKAPKVYIDPTQIPEDLKEFLRPGRIRTVDDLVDYAAMVTSAMLQGKIPPHYHRILKEMGELMFAAIASKGTSKTGFDLAAAIQAENIQINLGHGPPQPAQLLPPTPMRQIPSAEGTRGASPMILELDFSGEAFTPRPWEQPE